ncbi:MAG: hypothetical protein KKD25_01705 [Gammaproteobacteria bacterium]|jgi:hypothetical protein|nr:hypothetical protein [Gammaproteobacteria bacterium]MBU0771763.1 hypothetical protein [Gammaproteobacteria bacterium]MBU0855519.1 hypothetical protein [Gammaproteobacteria bacterium]MBU1846081.1 hypothetical protein [Gammaproteobacteria bacterium]
MDKHERAAMRMQKHGGSFVRLLGATYMAADEDNRKPLLAAYPVLFARYGERFECDAYDATDRTAIHADCASVQK